MYSQDVGRYSQGVALGYDLVGLSARFSIDRGDDPGWLSARFLRVRVMILVGFRFVFRMFGMMIPVGFRFDVRLIGVMIPLGFLLSVQLLGVMILVDFRFDVLLLGMMILVMFQFCLLCPCLAMFCMSIGGVHAG